MNGTDPPPADRGVLVDPAQRLTFSFEGRTIPALAGQSIAAALYAAGVRCFSRSFKYHRPRGLFCCSGDCPNCLMQVAGKPNVRTCIEPARQGQVVCHQNAWPSLDFDVLRVFDKLDRFLPVGFYYKRFHRPRWLWPIFEHTVRHIAGLGRIDLNAVPEADTEIEHIHADVCVVGGGPAGLAAAAEAASAGASVVLLERMPRLGGHLLYSDVDSSGPTIPGPADGGSTREKGGSATARTPYSVLSTRSVSALTHEIESCLHFVHNSPGVQVLCDTTAFGLYEGNLLGAYQRNRFLKLRAKQVIVCTGGRQRPFVFHHNDLPGIMLGRGALRLARLHGVLPGRRAVVVTDCDRGARLAAELVHAGVDEAVVVDTRAHSQNTGGTANWQVMSSSSIVAAVGHSRLRAVEVRRIDPSGQVADTQRIRCDLLCMASELVPANELLLQAGMRFRFDRGRWIADRTVNGLSAAGAAAGTLDLAAQIVEGRVRGAEAAAALGHSAPNLLELQQQWQATIESNREPSRSSAAATPHSSLLTPYRRSGKRFVCLCEDVTEKDLQQAIAEGFDNIETLKRYSTASMGPCQGKMCGLLATEVCARALGRDLNAVGTTTSRPPAVPVEMCVLAADAHYPIRRTPLHHWHEAAGAKWMDAGQWKRPESYGDPLDEVRLVRTGVGLIDVSTLGKIEVVGPDAVELLERVYLNKWSDLKVGRSRYGVMCNEDGIIFDDGVCARLAPDRFYLTATTGNSELVFQWLDMWRATWRLNATILSHTSGFAAMNVAGPRSREVLGRLTPLDLSPAKFPYMAMREGEVAGVPCRLLRIGFVGELGYEIHCPSALAWHLWETLCEAGRESGLQPFGVEAQRVLRLEKGHIIIGADTDALSNPLEAGLDWLARFDKPQFIGREPLVRFKQMGPRSQLVGFVLNDERLQRSEVRDQKSEVKDRDSTFIIHRSSFDVSSMEGCQVVDAGRPVGRVTSARYSPTLGRSIGLAWLPAVSANAGEYFFIRCNGADVRAIVAPLPFYDSDAERLKM